MPNRLFTPYFPKSDGPASRLNSASLPPPPEEIGPIFDPVHSSQPLDAYDVDDIHAIYGDISSQTHDSKRPPSPPQEFNGRYLSPILTKHERLRLTLLWYYTRDIVNDKEFLASLQDKLDLIQQFMGWEFAIIGLLSEDVFSRLVTAGLPLAMLPRRESTCSHTVNQPSGSVFMIPDMGNDWRFKHSPHVEEGGLRSYAGTHLRCKADSGDDIALGSLCIASNTPQEELPKEQQAALIRFADMMSAEIINRSRQSRKQQRMVMSELLGNVQTTATPDTVEASLRDIIVKVYPHVEIFVQQSTDHSVRVPGRKEPIHFDDVHDGLWEDSELIDHIILTQNHQKLHTDYTVRAIVYACQTQPLTKYLVVTSRELQYVFDDVDAWFIERCALVLRNTVQEGRLREALEAKDRFLRGITHQLRTPIHGVLGSVDLLAEELASRNLLDDGPLVDSSYGALTASSFLRTIRDSGRELMSTVNNMLKLNRWAESGAVVQPASLQTLKQIEADILHDVVSTIPERELSQISLMFENQLATDDCMIVIDLVLLRECIQPLIINALQFTQKGAVIITISGSSDYSRIRFDIVDTGCGIRFEDQKRIFEPYEKVDQHTRGAGLGLTLAPKIAHVLNGRVTLVSSEMGLGSHFRAEFLDPGFACPIDRHQFEIPKLEAMPKQFHVIPADKERPDLVLHFASYLTHRGYRDANTPDGSMIIITYTPDLDEFRKLVATVDPRHVAMTLIPAGAATSLLHGKHEVRFFSGPFLTTRLEEILEELDTIYKRLNSDPELGETASGTRDKGSSKCSTDGISLLSPADSQPRALLVDDNVVNLRIMRMYCEKRKIPYVTATDGQEAIQKFQESIDKNEPANMILMDLQMPVCDGVDATRKIRELEEEHILQPSIIFMVTGQDSAEDKSRSFEAGVSDFYVKPMSIKSLDRGIGEYFPGFPYAFTNGDMKSKKK